MSILWKIEFYKEKSAYYCKAIIIALIASQLDMEQRETFNIELWPSTFVFWGFKDKLSDDCDVK